MDQLALKKLVNKLIDEKLKLVCEECRKKTTQKKLGYHNFNISIQPTPINFDFSIDNENKENCLSSNRNANRVKASKSQALDLGQQIFNADISVIRPISQFSSPTVKASRKKSMPFLKKETQTTYEKVLKSKK
ncbi:unnamed protein product (macronuclear) [Paramecium tetraurelia]|uniref:Uncharacterized protein n=1 Tax=Paramecium tetraurelia TaxID=5888 RepID=A0DLI1_PARTE|nr:uncharacterized protein GSPATT00018215001 [Paramecium tetraurelia]CAK83898.1 unnamed protein product [Paramecium tetraurelia]|eukprot:XP_001451295.1 hypothetical protein (macronuclear) [Paramecium tetraurelia strain d4-2]